MAEKKNKWILEIADRYSIEDSEVIRGHLIAIPPTKGNRTDILTEAGRYHYNINKKQWNKIRRGDSIAIIIQIKKGKITLKGKF